MFALSSYGHAVLRFAIRFFVSFVGFLLALAISTIFSFASSVPISSSLSVIFFIVKFFSVYTFIEQLARVAFIL